MKKTLRYGQVGGSLGAFIGGVHRIGIAFDGRAALTAGCFSRKEEANRETGEFYGLDPARVYGDFETMAKAEGAREDGIDFAVITTPNNAHYAAAKAFLENGIHVLCEKPLCFTVGEAEELCRLAEEKGLLFGVNYSYSGNVMVKEARAIIRRGDIGEIINVNAEYLQEYLVDDVGKSGDAMLKLSSWRKDPEVAGISNCVGDIGSHIEHTVAYMTGLKLKRVAAMLDRFGQPLDLNANILVEYENGAHGVYSCSQVCVGHMNGLVTRIYGTEGAIEWVQENPNILYVTKKGQPTEIHHRGMGYVSGEAAAFSRLPSGHPEGLFVAFANIYKAFLSAVLKKANGEPLTAADLDFPTARDGLDGVRFVRACVESGARDAAWVEV
ncbi:MAG: Gfo/Idh/MocA family oxidoreductase [Clostridia bacterium]|nr:Gfo/Idh/MocA family oxidoreductase [Clostridia bacterium]